MLWKIFNSSCFEKNLKDRNLILFSRKNDTIDSLWINIPYQLVGDNQSASSCPFDLDLTGRTWPVSCQWWRGQNPLDTPERCPSGVFPGAVKPIFALLRLFPTESKVQKSVHETGKSSIDRSHISCYLIGLYNFLEIPHFVWNKNAFFFT